EAPQAGRFRQFWQVGAEAIGSDDPAVDAESVLLLVELLEAVGVRELRLRVSSLGGPVARAAYRDELQNYLREHEQELPAVVRERIELNPLRAFDSDDARTRELMAGAPRLLDRLEPDDAAHFADVRAMLDDAEIGYEVDSTLVRGLDYYTRTVFEFESAALGAQSGVGGGGRYDGLVAQLGGPAAPGCGWAAGIERMLLATDDSSREPLRDELDLFVAYAGGAQRRRALQLVHAARRAGLPAQLELAGRSLKGQLKQADRLGARYVAIVGESDVQLKDMATGDQRAIDPAELPAAVQRQTA
ncbi:MAG TPA: ATP phosphoribosyltransferase regulatory subunit, partial [Solirubrobacteraceae bacterium]|nr:ATP phosphoribosyltransferase regulatory subunit [Solirubrobacteraceae bacterium]